MRRDGRSAEERGRSYGSRQLRGRGSSRTTRLAKKRRRRRRRKRFGNREENNVEGESPGGSCPSDSPSRLTRPSVLFRVPLRMSVSGFYRTPAVRFVSAEGPRRTAIAAAAASVSQARHRSRRVTDLRSARDQNTVFLSLFFANLAKADDETRRHRPHSQHGEREREMRRILKILRVMHSGDSLV